jgi:transcription-repair coupling factor (superfamily II helicase)
MTAFLDGERDVLVATAIIESGLDVPRANTLIVNRADHFGLSQLYQIRGRVGRSHHRAFCYLLIPDEIQEDAEKRLRVLEHYTELGSGYRIALKDLELRGAGNILGSQQSGFVHAVGLDTYMRLLDDTIKQLKGNGETRVQLAEVSVDGAALIPDDYVTDEAQKLNFYRRLSRVETVQAADAIRASCATATARCAKRWRRCSPPRSCGCWAASWGSSGSWCVRGTCASTSAGATCRAWRRCRPPSPRTSSRWRSAARCRSRWR